MDDIVLAVQKMYDSAGEYFSKTRQKKYGKTANWPFVQEYLDQLRPGQNVLDVGCGDGRLLSGMPAGVEYLGIDFSRTLIEIAKEKYPDREFRLGNIIEGSTWEGLSNYERVFCIATLHHIPTKNQQLQVLENIKSAAMKGGALYLTVWNLWQEKMIQRGLTRGTMRAGEVVNMDFDKHEGRHVVAMDLPYLVKLMQEAGWEIENSYYADRGGKQTDILNGRNLVVVAKN